MPQATPLEDRYAWSGFYGTLSSRSVEYLRWAGSHVQEELCGWNRVEYLS